MVYPSPSALTRRAGGLLMALAMIDSAQVQAGVFSTWKGLKADKCASIWLIQRVIDPAAEIRFYPKGQSLSEGIPFDTPQAALRRYPTKSTFETLLEHYRIADPKLGYIGQIVHDIQMNIWEKKRMVESLTVERDMQAILAQGHPESAVERCRTYFDRLYEHLLSPRNP